MYNENGDYMDKIQNLELQFLRFLRGISNPFVDFFTEAITFLGEEYIIIFLLVILYFTIDKKLGKKIAYIIFTSTSLNGAIKGLVSRPRPFVVDPTLDSVRKQTATGHSFPSGHTQNATSTYIGIAYNNNYKRKMFIIIAIIISLLIGFSRLVLAVHYPTDVLFGFILGSICAISLSILFNKFATNSKNEHLLYIFTFIIFIPLAFIFYKPTYEEIHIYKGFYTIISMFAGFILGSLIEAKYVNFHNNVSLKIKAIRILGVGIIYLLIQIGLKAILPKQIIFIDMFRYFMLTFTILGIYPLLFKNNLFKKD